MSSPHHDTDPAATDDFIDLRIQCKRLALALMHQRNTNAEDQIAFLNARNHVDDMRLQILEQQKDKLFEAIDIEKQYARYLLKILGFAREADMTWGKWVGVWMIRGFLGLAYTYILAMLNVVWFGTVVTLIRVVLPPKEVPVEAFPAVLFVALAMLWVWDRSARRLILVIWAVCFGLLVLAGPLAQVKEIFGY